MNKHLDKSSQVIFFPPPTHFSSISSELFRVVEHNIAVLDPFHPFSCRFTDWTIHQFIFGISWILLIVVCNLFISIEISMKSSRGNVERDGVPLKEYLRCSGQFLFVLCSDTLQVPMKNRCSVFSSSLFDANDNIIHSNQVFNSLDYRLQLFVQPRLLPCSSPSQQDLLL
jgi:hypothetical protein